MTFINPRRETASGSSNCDGTNSSIARRCTSAASLSSSRLRQYRLAEVVEESLVMESAMARVTTGEPAVGGDVVTVHQRFAERLLIGHDMIRIGILPLG